MKTKLLNMMPVVEEQQLITRLKYCVSVLWLHGYMPEKEHDKMRERIQKEMGRQGVQVKQKGSNIE